ncbi:hypothetical protein [Calditerrivibrio nitroreducens]|uniref:LPS export ABC transporter periplasmic protein LptC n=1 Tax=Calditerrivibrio nitroreducens (strain DSM 19672 / NBRC 101217 / Yu37-1) TaxID=768670 RepID=E4TK65_CALNY|nr:hypothetical protein [Calditerrivibrio nitroreducens]ADR19341.1 hypothetical protein Calni_1433 [Calditerrivibrio nitroreducens DSM 19672]
MGRNSKYLFYIAVLLLVAIFVGFVVYDINRPEVTRKSSETSYIEGFYLKSNLDNGSFYKINASKAYLFFENETVTFDNCSFYYEDQVKIVKGNGERCLFKKDKYVTIEKGLEGFYNSIEFKGGKDSHFFYDLGKYEGLVDGGVFARDGDNSIRSEKMRFNKNDIFVEFSGKVEVVYAK